MVCLSFFLLKNALSSKLYTPVYSMQNQLCFKLTVRFTNHSRISLKPLTSFEKRPCKSSFSCPVLHILTSRVSLDTSTPMYQSIFSLFFFMLVNRLTVTD